MTGDPITGSTLWGARIHGTGLRLTRRLVKMKMMRLLMMMAVITYNILIWYEYVYIISVQHTKKWHATSHKVQYLMCPNGWTLNWSQVVATKSPLTFFLPAFSCSRTSSYAASEFPLWNREPFLVGWKFKEVPDSVHYKKHLSCVTGNVVVLGDLESHNLLMEMAGFHILNLSFEYHFD